MTSYSSARNLNRISTHKENNAIRTFHMVLGRLEFLLPTYYALKIKWFYG